MFWRARRLGNTSKSKLSCLISLPQPLFSCSAVLRERERERERASYVLILRSFQEKYIPEGCFHVCHITEEKVSPCRPGSPPASSPKPNNPATCTSHGRGNSLHMPSTHLTQREYICTIRPLYCMFEQVTAIWLEWNYTQFIGATEKGQTVKVKSLSLTVYFHLY